MRKNPLKNFLFSFLSIIAMSALFSCVQPVNIKEFLEDDKVQEIIEADSVGLVNYTGENLRAGNRRITGLNPNNYYRIEVLDENEDSLDPPQIWFVRANGQLGELNQIGRVSGGQITGLNNNLFYAIWSASPLSGVMTLYDLPGPPDALSTGTPINPGLGGLSLVNPDDTYYLDLESLNSLSTYTIIRVPVLPPGTNQTINFINDNIIQLQNNGTIDYIFVEDDGTDEFASFRVLRVRIAGVGSLLITVSIDISDKAVLTPSTIPPVSQAALFAGPVSGLPTLILSGFDTGSVRWLYNNVLIHGGTTLDLNNVLNNNEDYWLIGTHVFYVEGTITTNGAAVPYSASFDVIITP
ncbi:MAG: hypothetical protein LBC80_07010 [Treponema sp.]|nr:hypothetical protein [Treponema sp.]